MFKQGKIFERNQRKYNRLVNNDKLNLISINQLNIVQKLKTHKYSSIREGYRDMKNMKNPNKLDDLNEEETAKLVDLENQFNSKLEEYKVKYKDYLNELTSGQSISYRKLHHKIVKYEDQYYYVSESGNIRKFDLDAQIPDNRGRGCPKFDNIVLSAKEWNKFSADNFGNNLKPKERCDATNKIITDGTTSAWVDYMGYKHIFTSFHDKNETCKKTPLEISSEEFNAIESSTPFNKDSKCITNIGNGLERELLNINEELKSILHEIQGEVAGLQGKSVGLNKKVVQQKEDIVSKYNQLQKDKKKLSNMKTNDVSYGAKIKEQKLLVPSVEMHNYIWVVLAGTFIVTAIYNLK